MMGSRQRIRKNPLPDRRRHRRQTDGPRRSGWTPATAWPTRGKSSWRSTVPSTNGRQRGGRCRWKNPRTHPGRAQCVAPARPIFPSSPWSRAVVVVGSGRAITSVLRRPRRPTSHGLVRMEGGRWWKCGSTTLTERRTTLSLSSTSTVTSPNGIRVVLRSSRDSRQVGHRHHSSSSREEEEVTSRPATERCTCPLLHATTTSSRGALRTTSTRTMTHRHLGTREGGAEAGPLGNNTPPLPLRVALLQFRRRHPPLL
mmetsp:Transcript_537/g.717  ORF Transcript_537/g.717 Transcript_537/m.717 type:complete len:256 (+) Transcript_537:440-1207(+)